MHEGQPELWILTGPSGAGKSTYAPRICAEFSVRHGHTIEYFNPDESAKREGINAGDALLKFYDETILEHRRRQRSVLVETTIPGITACEVIDDFRRDGYRIVVVAVGVATPEIAETNVRNRINLGGHDAFVEVTYKYCKMYTPRVLGLADEAHVYDNSKRQFIEMVSRTDHQGFVLHVPLADIAADKNPYMHGIVGDLIDKGLLGPALIGWRQRNEAAKRSP